MTDIKAQSFFPAGTVKDTRSAIRLLSKRTPPTTTCCIPKYPKLHAIAVTIQSPKIKKTNNTFYVIIIPAYMGYSTTPMSSWHVLLLRTRETWPKFINKEFAFYFFLKKIPQYLTLIKKTLCK